MVKIDPRTQIGPSGKRLTPKELKMDVRRHSVAAHDDKERNALLVEMIKTLDERAKDYEEIPNVKTLVEAIDFIKMLRKDMTMVIRGLGDLATLELDRDG